MEHLPRKTKIVCTIGPTSSSKRILKKLMCSGMDVVRLNCSHGNHEDFKKLIKKIRTLAKELDKPISIMLDLRGPKLRVGNFKDGAIELKKGETVIVTVRDVIGKKGLIPVNYPRLAEDLKIGEELLFNDGLLKVIVKEITDVDITCEILVGGTLEDKKGLNVPGTIIFLPSLTEKDHNDLKFGIKEKVDFVALSFVQKPVDIVELREILNVNESNAQIVSKIEKPEALKHIDEIIDLSDAIMVARGDLGVEMQPCRVPGIQKTLIKKCTENNVPVITATQMLESMVNNPSPTRAEASDVANAIYDGTDAVMLSAETASGKFPVKTVEVMAQIALETEKTIQLGECQIRKKERNDGTIRDAIARGASKMAQSLNCSAIVVYNLSGKTSCMISKYKNNIPILALTPFPQTLRKLNLYWGVLPILIETPDNTEEVVSIAERACKNFEFIQPEDLILITTGISGSTNAIKIHALPENFRKT
ncbi:pyruvate kinase [Candidatus Riflebacteria bacterium]